MTTDKEKHGTRLEFHCNKLYTFGCFVSSDEKFTSHTTNDDLWVFKFFAQNTNTVLIVIVEVHTNATCIRQIESKSNRLNPWKGANKR